MAERIEAAAGARAEGGVPVWAAFAMLTFAVLLWSGSAVAGRAAAGNVPPIALSFWRWVFAFLVFLPIGGPTLWRRREAALRAWPWLALLSFLGMGGFAVPYFWGLQYTQAVNAAILNALSPVMILVIAAVVLPGARIGGRDAAGVALGIGGTALIIFRGDWREAAGFSINEGDALLLVAILFWSIYTIALRRAPKELDWSALMLALSALTVPMLAPFYAWELASAGGFELSTGNLAIVLYSGVFSSVVAYVCWNAGVARVGPAKAGFSQYLMPVFGALLAWAILGETLEWFHLAGVIAIFAGIAWSSGKRRAG